MIFRYKKEYRVIKNDNCVDLIYLDKDNIFMEFMVENKRGDFVKTSTVF